MNNIAVQQKKSRLRVLIVEDNVVNQHVLIGMLKHVGNYEIEVAQHGQQALDLYTAACGDYDLVLMDCEMPVMGGVDATHKIREYEAGKSMPATPIIIITAHATEDNKRRCYQAGADDFITKPVSFETISGMMADYCPDIA